MRPDLAQAFLISQLLGRDGYPPAHQTYRGTESFSTTELRHIAPCPPILIPEIARAHGLPWYDNFGPCIARTPYHMGLIFIGGSMGLS